MATIKRFEDMFVWKKSRILVREVYKNLSDCQDRGFRDQIQRASVSVLSNISEGFESGTKVSFLNYLYISKASAGEVRAQLYIASDIGYLKDKDFEYLKGLAEECSRLLSSLIKKVKMGAEQGLQRKVEEREDPMRETMREYGMVKIKSGAVVSKERAEKEGLEIIDDYS